MITKAPEQSYVIGPIRIPQSVETPSRQDNVRFNWFVAALFVFGALAALPFDVRLAEFFMSDPLPGELRSFIHKSEFFGHAYGILGIVFTIYLVAEPLRRHLPRLLCTAFAAGLACDVVKTLFHRVRPVDFSFAAEEATFKGISFLHAETLGQVFDSQFHSFPSAHTATAVAFAIALGQLFPKAGRWFLFLAGLCAVSRFDGGAHFVSDTFVGALLGYSVAFWMLNSRRVDEWFNALEHRVFNSFHATDVERDYFREAKDEARKSRLNPGLQRTHV